MANTTNINITTPDTWVEIASESTGIVSVGASGQHCVYTGTPPETLIGHRFTGDMIAFSLGAGESLWVKSMAVTTVIITEDQ